jgi:NMD protein affecting ribosome stability and mRNA decay
MAKKILPENLPTSLPKPKKEEQEFGPGKRDVLVCPECNAVYFYKSWHHRLEDYPHLKENKDVRFKLCPACIMIKNGKFEGEVIIENLDGKNITDLINTIKNMGDSAIKRDNQDRIIKIKEKENKIRVITTENQLAQKIANKIKKTFNFKNLEIKYSKGESVVRARLS